jgi:IS5 family transposase
VFRDDLETIREKERKNAAGRKPFDTILMFKILVLQSLYNLSDDAVEYQVRDRLSFMRFLGIGIGDRVPDAKTIWLFREQLGEAKLVKRLFKKFDRSHKHAYGYKNHISIDARHKIIRDYAVTDASVHDSHVFWELLDETNSSRDVWADSAYRSEENTHELARRDYREHLQRKGCRHKKLTDWEKQGNRTRSRIRCRIEHVFGIQAQMAGTLLLRTIGKTRAEIKIGLRNLAYNIHRIGIITASTA